MNSFLNAGHLKLLATSVLLGLSCQHDNSGTDVQQAPSTPQDTTPSVGSLNAKGDDAPAAKARLPIEQPLKADVSGLTLVDSLDIGDTKSELAHKYLIDAPTFAGTNDYDVLEAGSATSFRETLRATKSFETFVLKVTPGKEHVLVKGVDTLSRDQKVHVLINGKPMSSEWTMPNGPERYEEASLLIPASTIGAREEISLRFEFRGASIDLNSLHYWLYAKPASTAALQ